MKRYTVVGMEKHSEAKRAPNSEDEDNVWSNGPAMFRTVALMESAASQNVNLFFWGKKMGDNPSLLHRVVKTAKRRTHGNSVFHLL